MKLNKEKVLEIVKLSETLNNTEIAKHFGVHVQSIVYWKKRLKNEGYEVKSLKKKGINLKQDDTNITI